MAIQPIDLQVLFSRLDQVGKEQAAQKDVPVHNQAVHGAEIVKKTDQQAHSVNETREIEKTGVSKVSDEKRRRRPPGSGGEERRKEEEEEEPRREVLRDPNLGKNIDITG